MNPTLTPEQVQLVEIARKEFERLRAGGAAIASAQFIEKCSVEAGAITLPSVALLEGQGIQTGEEQFLSEALQQLFVSLSTKHTDQSHSEGPGLGKLQEGTEVI
jgi:hypothetical protein